MKFPVILFILSVFVYPSSSSQDFKFSNKSPFQKTIERKFLHSINLIDCIERAPILFHYKATADTGNSTRYNTFTFDPLVKRDCQQKSTRSYGNIYDRGHMVPANHLDFDAKAIRESNYMTNILPQHKALNRGAWLLSEEIIECYRDKTDLEIIGGLIMGNNTKNDLFLKTHGIRTPDFFWKIILSSKKGNLIAWIMPNDETAVKSNIDKYLTSVHNIEQRSGFYFPSITNKHRHNVEAKSWTLPKNCKTSK